MTEQTERYEVQEIEYPFEAAEISERYEWKEDALEMRTFTLGEEKEVGVEINSTDGTSFSIVSATYKYKDGSVTLAEGGAVVDGHRVFILLEPIIASYTQKIVFTVTLQPLDENGQPDVTKNQETIKATVNLTVIE